MVDLQIHCARWVLFVGSEQIFKAGELGLKSVSTFSMRRLKSLH